MAKLKRKKKQKHSAQISLSGVQKLGRGRKKQVDINCILLKYDSLNNYIFPSFFHFSSRTCFYKATVNLQPQFHSWNMWLPLFYCNPHTIFLCNPYVRVCVSVCTYAQQQSHPSFQTHKLREANSKYPL